MLATPGFVFFGWLSDKIGRKPIIMAGCLLAMLTYFPLFGALTRYANPALYAAQAAAPVTVVADPKECSFQFDPIGKNHIRFDFLRHRQELSWRRPACPIKARMRRRERIAQIRSGTQHADRARSESGDGRGAQGGDRGVPKTRRRPFLSAAGYPDKADPAAINKPMVVLILFILVLYVTMVYGPIAALLVELFPARIRYSAMSLPYHIGNGWFGGFLPTTAFAMVAATGDIYYGLWYPIVVAGRPLVVGLVVRCPKPSSAPIDA